MVTYIKDRWRDILRWIAVTLALSIYSGFVALGGSTYQWLTDAKAYNQSLAIIQAKQKDCPTPPKKRATRY